MWAGLAVKTGNHHWEFKSVAEMEDLSSANEEVKMYGGRIMTGADGPHASIRSTNPEQVTGTGFLIRKYVDREVNNWGRVTLLLSVSVSAKCC